MSQLEILSPHCPIDINVANIPTAHSDSFPGSFNSWNSGSGLHELISRSPTATRVTERRPEDEPIFPALPPLRTGHAEIQLRNGIMRASRLASAGEIDSEKAFFVADLGQVYLQHQRWMKALPEIQPHYGT